MPRSITLNLLAQILLPARYTDLQLQRALDSTGNDDVQRAAEVLLLGIGSSKPSDLNGWLRPARRKSGDEDGEKKRKRKVINRDGEETSDKRKSRLTSKGQTEPIILSSSEDEPQVISHINPLHRPIELTIAKPDLNAKPELKPDITQQTAPSPTRLLTLGTLLQPPPPSRRNIARPPLTLTTPQAISTHLPCSLLPSPLSPAFASSLYLSLLDASKTELTKDEQGEVIREGFRRHEWYLNGRLVVSPHTSGYYRLTEEQGGVKDGGEYCTFGFGPNGNVFFWLRFLLLRQGMLGRKNIHLQ